MQERVLASHLAMVNVYLVLDADKDFMPTSKQKSLNDSEINKHNRDLKQVKERIRGMVSSPATYIRATGYHELFDLKPEPLKAARTQDVRQEVEARERRLRASLQAAIAKGDTWD